jgi:DNA-directed RNA polymerase specialized sigma24 family protein
MLKLKDDDIERIESLIRAMVAITCRRWNLRKEQVGDDMAQDCWAEVLRVKDRYDPNRGASLTTFLYLSVTRVCGRSAQRIKKRGVAELTIDDRHHAQDAGGRMEDLETLSNVDVRVAAAAMGFSDAEIAEMLGETPRETTRRRREAAREQKRPDAS